MSNRYLKFNFENESLPGTRQPFTTCHTFSPDCHLAVLQDFPKKIEIIAEM